MLKIPVYNLEGKETKNVELKDKSFSVEFNPALVHQVMVSLQNNQRVSKAHTKTRGEVKGGGKKPWKQKGTGRARAGSIRSPLWVGGGVTFGPRSDKNYSTKINKKVGKLVLAMVFAKKSLDNEIKLVEDWKISKPKTKELSGIIEKLGVSNHTILLVASEKNATLNRAGNNLPKVSIKTLAGVNVLDLLSHKFVVIEKEALDKLEKRLAAKITK